MATETSYLGGLQWAKLNSVLLGWLIDYRSHIKTQFVFILYLFSDCHYHDVCWVTGPNRGKGSELSAIKQWHSGNRPLKGNWRRDPKHCILPAMRHPSNSSSRERTYAHPLSFAPLAIKQTTKSPTLCAPFRKCVPKNNGRRQGDDDTET